MIDNCDLLSAYNAGDREGVIVGYLPRLRYHARDVVFQTQHFGNYTIVEDLVSLGYELLLKVTDATLGRRAYENARHLAYSYRKSIVGGMRKAYYGWLRKRSDVEIDDSVILPNDGGLDPQKWQFIDLAVKAAFEQATAGEIELARAVVGGARSVSAAAKQCGIKRETVRDSLKRLGCGVVQNASVELQDAVPGEYQWRWDALEQSGRHESPQTPIQA